ncbi:MAG: DUF1292 domain-containing protein [Ruminococcus sp.]|nr:DUF1292 domain-containing protein [Ruminococcus sp.]
MSEEMMDYTPDLYTLIDDDGNETTFELLDAMEVDGEEYFALTPYFGDDAEAVLQDDGEVVILKSAIDEAGEEIMQSIDDEEEYERIGKIFMERLEEVFDFVEEGECDCGEPDCDCHLS